MLPSSDHFDLGDLMTRDGFHDISQTEQKYYICVKTLMGTIVNSNISKHLCTYELQNRPVRKELKLDHSSC